MGGHTDENPLQAVVAEVIDWRTASQVHGLGCPPPELLLSRASQVHHVDRSDQRVKHARLLQQLAGDDHLVIDAKEQQTRVVLPPQIAQEVTE